MKLQHQSSKIHIYVGSSNKAKRLSHSTSHAETLSAAKFIPVGQLVALRLCEPDLAIYFNTSLSPGLLMNVQDRGMCMVPHDHYIDCMDLWELSCGLKGIPQDKSQRLGVLSIREERRTERLRRLFHVTTQWMLADCLTKHSGYFSKSLHQLLSCGYWSVQGPLRVRQGFGRSELSEQQPNDDTEDATEHPDYWKYQ